MMNLLGEHVTKKKSFFLFQLHLPKERKRKHKQTNKHKQHIVLSTFFFSYTTRLNVCMPLSARVSSEQATDVIKNKCTLREWSLI